MWIKKCNRPRPQAAALARPTKRGVYMKQQVVGWYPDQPTFGRTIKGRTAVRPGAKTHKTRANMNV